MTPSEKYVAAAYLIVFVGVLALIVRPGAKSRAQAAARIPLDDDFPIEKADK